MKRCKVTVRGAVHAEHQLWYSFWVRASVTTHICTCARCSILDNEEATIVDQIVHVR